MITEATIHYPRQQTGETPPQDINTGISTDFWECHKNEKPAVVTTGFSTLNLIYAKIVLEKHLVYCESSTY